MSINPWKTAPPLFPRKRTVYKVDKFTETGGRGTTMECQSPPVMNVTKHVYLGNVLKDELHPEVLGHATLPWKVLGDVYMSRTLLGIGFWKRKYVHLCQPRTSVSVQSEAESIKSIGLLCPGDRERYRDSCLNQPPWGYTEGDVLSKTSTIYLRAEEGKCPHTDVTIVNKMY